MLRITLFGQFSAALGDQPLRLSLRPKTLEFWAYLLLYPHEPLPRPALAFALWPDADEKTALTNCRRHLNHLKTLLTNLASDVPWLVADTKTVRWHPDAPAWVDVMVFRQWVAHDATLADAVNLVTGDLLQDVYADWLLHERERCRERYLNALSRLTDLHILSRDYPQATQYAQRLLASDPLRETSVRQVMRLLYAAGDRAGALATYQDFVKRLRHELDVEPMEQTVALHQDILSTRARAGEITPDDAPAAAGDARKATTESVFVGRAAELAQLRAVWDRVGAGHGQAVFIGGAAGIGKTRLAEALANIAHGQGAWVLTGGAAFTEPVPQQAFVEALTAALPAVVDAVDDPQTLAPLLPFIPQMRQLHPDLSAIPPGAQAHTRQEVFAAFAACFMALSRARPLLLVLEDFHWASAYTVAMLKHLLSDVLHSALHRPLLVVVTYRPEDTPRSHPLRDLLRRLRRERFSTQMTLDALDAEAVRALLTLRLGRLAQPDATAAAFLRLSDGNPLFVHELLRYYSERGWLRRQDDGWHLHADEAQTAPPHLQAIVQERLTQLSPEARTLAEIAAVLGAAFDLELICEVSGWTERAAYDGLHELLDRGLIREASGANGFDYAFSHTLIQQTLYMLLDASDRQRRHRRAAQVMREIYGEAHDAVLLLMAQHYEGGGLGEEAARFYLKAAQRDHRLYAHQEALGLIGTALALTEDARLRFDLLALRETLEAVEADRAAQVRTIDVLAQLAAHDTDLTCEVWVRRVRLMHASSDLAGLRAALDGLALAVKAAESPRWQAELALARGLHAMQSSDFDAAERAAAEALARFQALDDIDALLRCYAALTETALHRGDFEQARKYITQMQADDHAQIAARLHHLKHAGTHAFMAQQWQISLDFFAALLEEAGQYRDPQSVMLAHFYLAMTYARLSSFLLAETHYSRAAELVARYGSPALKTALYINRGTFRAAVGQVRAALRDFEQARRMVSRTGDKRGLYTCAHNLSILYQWMGRLAAARRHAEGALKLAEAMNSLAYRANALSSLGVIEREAGAYHAAIAHLQEAVTLRQQSGAQQTALLEDLVELATAHLAADNRESATHLLADCLALLAEADHATYHFQRVLWSLARLCQSVGDAETAARLTDDAHALLQHQAQQLSPAQQTAYLDLPFNRVILNATPRG